MSGSGMK